jgi:hypothetical protein
VRGTAVLLLGLTVGVSACSTTPQWQAPDRPTRIDGARLLESASTGPLFRDAHADEIPVIPPRHHLRPCCAFGTDLGVRVGPVPIPSIAIGNVIGTEDLGEHSYDAGAVTLRSDDSQWKLIRSEGNGLVYTCRGGFIDTAHIRDYADTMIFLVTTIARSLEFGATIEMPDEGGKRQIHVDAVDEDLIRRLGRTRIALPIAQWLAFELSLWHEIVTWYGWSTYATFPEAVSSFSPEDLYSNVIGIRIAAAIAAQRTARTEELYEHGVDAWMRVALDYLGAVPRPVAIDAMKAVDHLWWTSDARLPDKGLVLRRNFTIEPELVPWLVPPDRMPASLRRACGEAPRALSIPNPSAGLDPKMRQLVHVEIEVAPDVATHEPFASLGRPVTLADFPAIIEQIRRENRAEFGPDADRSN